VESSARACRAASLLSDRRQRASAGQARPENNIYKPRLFLNDISVLSKFYYSHSLSRDEGCHLANIDSNMDPSDVKGGSPKEISDKILELLSNKCQIATVALDKNWTYQIISLGVGLGLIYGLGEALSRKLLDDSSHETIIRLILPYINLYFVMRFGQFASYFSSKRIALKKAATIYCTKSGVENLKQDDIQDLIKAISTTTNSLDYYYQDGPTYREYIYSLFFPLVIGSNHAVSLYLLHTLPINITVQIILICLYVIPHILLYRGFYVANKDLIDWPLDQGKKFNYTMALLMLTVIFTILVYSLIAGNPPARFSAR
jgi:hypothetical protein